MKKFLLSLVLILVLAGGAFFAWKNNYLDKILPSSKKETVQSASKEVSNNSKNTEASQEQVKKNDGSQGTTAKKPFEDLNGGKPIYYYGSECPHCKDVLAFLDKNDIYSKVDFIKKEVWHDQNNGMELTEAARKCGKDPSKIGVPFLFDNGKCYMGGPEVEGFFAQKAGIEVE